jgi:hypothetical protein
MRDGHIYRTWLDIRYLIIDSSNEYIEDGTNLGINLCVTKKCICLEFVISRFSLVIYLGFIERVYGGISSES